MNLVVIAAYILFITVILIFSTRILWLLFLLFCYRFWEMFLPLDKISQFIQLTHDWHYHLMLWILAAITYFCVYFLTMEMQFIRYIVLLIIAFFVIRHYEITDIFFFKDYLDAHGMWSLDYWVNQVKEIFTSSSEEKESLFGKVWEDVKGAVRAIFGYGKEL